MALSPDPEVLGEPREVPAFGFSVDLPAYSGPFDALLSMIANRRLELTEISLAAVTGEFIEYVRGLDLAQNMEQASAFIDVASILVEAKSASLLPDDMEGREDEQNLEALRERDMLFARLVQYRAFKNAGEDFGLQLKANEGRFPHPAGARILSDIQLPELEWTLSADDFAALAAQVFIDAPAPRVSLNQLHVAKVDLRLQSRIVSGRLSSLGPEGSMTFAQLTDDAASRLEVVARFFAVLVFFKQGVLQYRQSGPFEDLHLRWVAGAGGSALDKGDFS